MIININGKNSHYTVSKSLEIEYIDNEAIVYSPDNEIVLLLNLTGMKIYKYLLSLNIDDVVVYEDIARYLIMELEICELSENLLKEIIDDVEHIVEGLIEYGIFINKTQ